MYIKALQAAYQPSGSAQLTGDGNRKADFLIPANLNRSTQYGLTDLNVAPFSAVKVGHPLQKT